ncbi:MAG: DNA repair protein RecO [Anaerolineae bacterium]|nr:DNA repair protein RecO [Anaerolineae bacterium]
MGSASRARLYRTEAIILRRRDFGEADRILTLYAPGSGKTRVLAKGVRKPKSRKSGHVELLAHSNLLIAKGRNLDIVTQAEMIHSFLPIRRDLVRTSYAYYAAELLDLFVEEGIENRPLFDLLLAVLGWLGDASDLDLTTRFFELRLLSLLGYRPQLFQCVACRRQIEPVANFFSAADGGILCANCGENHRGAQEITLNALKVLRFLQTRDYDTCCRLRLSPPLHRELETLMYHYITYTLERSLKSVKFLKTLRRQWVGK